MRAAPPARVALLRLGCAHTSDLGAKREIGPGADPIILRPSGCCRAPEGGLNGAFDAAGIPAAVMDLREVPLHDTVPGIRLPGRRSREGNAVALRLADFVLAATRRMTLPASRFPGDRRVSDTVADPNPEATPCGDQTEVLPPPGRDLPDQPAMSPGSDPADARKGAGPRNPRHRQPRRGRSCPRTRPPRGTRARSRGRRIRRVSAGSMILPRLALVFAATVVRGLQHHRASETRGAQIVFQMLRSPRRAAPDRLALAATGPTLGLALS